VITSTATPTPAPTRPPDAAPDASAMRPGRIDMARLLPHHLADLRRSALTDETIEAAGLYSLDDPAAISRILNWKQPATDLGPCLVIPFRDIEGKFDGFARVRPDRPLSPGRKYEQPMDVSSRAFFPPGAIDAIRRPGALLAVVEGEKKGSSDSRVRERAESHVSRCKASMMPLLCSGSEGARQAILPSQCDRGPPEQRRGIILL